MKLKEMSEKCFKKYQLKKLNDLFKKAERELYKLNISTRNELLEFHTENYSLPYCIKWGLQATEELLGVEEDE